jgi:hypothetical protein
LWRSQVYSFGVTAWEVLAAQGARPWEGVDAQTVFALVALHAERPPLHAVRRGAEWARARRPQRPLPRGGGAAAVGGGGGEEEGGGEGEAKLETQAYAFLRDVVARCWAQDPAARPTFAQVSRMFDDAEPTFAKLRERHH